MTTEVTESVDEKIERLLFGDDLKAITDEDHERAINIRPFTEFCSEVITSFNCDPNRRSPVEIWGWRNREGKPWQEEIERRVAAYRRKARPFSTDPAARDLVKSEMRKRGWLWMVWCDAQGITARFTMAEPGMMNMNHESTSDQESEAVALAAAAALEGK